MFNNCVRPNSGVDAEIRRYTTELTDQTVVKALESHEAYPAWGSRHTTYPRLAEDLIAAPASQAMLRDFSLFMVNYLLEREIVLGVV